ncbi:MAG TPA: FAD-dependent oxidoreductase [Terracidiphilus sp.]
MTVPAQTVEHLVIGGGPAGAMTAIRLAEAGRQVTLLEKESGPHHKVCGEFLSREAVEYLHSISIFPARLGAAPIRSVRISYGSRFAEAELPFQALSVSRRLLDTAMLERAAAAGCEVRQGAAVERLTRQGSGWSVDLASGECIFARAVFLASGKHDLRGWSRTRGVQNDLVGFKLHWRLRPAQQALLHECIHLFLFSGGYGGMSLIEEETANLCLVVRRSKLRQAGSWTAIVAAILDENRALRQLLGGAQPLQSRPLAISPIPYGYLAATSGDLWKVGDQAAVIPSFTGDGISIALHSGALAAHMYTIGGDSDDYMRTLHSQLYRPIRLATLLSRAMVSAPGRTAVPVVLALAPNVMRWIAGLTRIPTAALLHEGGASAHSRLAF